MKYFSLVFLTQLTMLLPAQHSPYFYPMPYAEREIINDEHAHFLKRVCFKPPDDDKTNDNVLKESEDGENLEFRPFGQIMATIYLEHSLKYYYDKYLADPGKKKEDWDYKKIEKEQEGKKDQLAHGWVVVIYKVNGNEIASQIYLQDQYQFKYAIASCGNIWYRPSYKKDESDNIYKEQAKENYFPLLIYLRDQAKPGRYKIEIEAYAGKMECEKTSQRSDELLAKGSMILVVNPEEAKEISECGGNKKIPTDIRFYTNMYGTFELK